MQIDINVHENRLLLAYMMKHVSAHYRVNKRDDSMAQMLARFLDHEAKEIETQTIKLLKDAHPSP